LKDDSIKLNLTPVVDHVLVEGQDPTRDFVKTMYFVNSPKVWDGEQKNFPKNAVLMTNNSNVDFLKQIGHFDRYYFYVKE
jgi:hypothetical protein